MKSQRIIIDPITRAKFYYVGSTDKNTYYKDSKGNLYEYTHKDFAKDIALGYIRVFDVYINEDVQSTKSEANLSVVKGE